MGEKLDINNMIKDFLEIQSQCIKEIKEDFGSIDKIIWIIFMMGII